MQIYIHERNDETTLILSEEGRILSIYPSPDDAWDNIYSYASNTDSLITALEPND